MIKYAVKYLKNSFYPLKGNDIEKLENIDGKLVLVRTEKGEEVLKAFLVNKEVAELFEKSDIVNRGAVADLCTQCGTIRRLLIASINTAKGNHNDK